LIKFSPVIGCFLLKKLKIQMVVFLAKLDLWVRSRRLELWEKLKLLEPSLRSVWHNIYQGWKEDWLYWKPCFRSCVLWLYILHIVDFWFRYVLASVSFSGLESYFRIRLIALNHDFLLLHIIMPRNKLCPSTVGSLTTWKSVKWDDE